MDSKLSAPATLTSTSPTSTAMPPPSTYMAANPGNSDAKFQQSSNPSLTSYTPPSVNSTAANSADTVLTSAALSTPMTVALPTHPWTSTVSDVLPTAPGDKISTPTLEPLAVDIASEWNNPLSSTPTMHMGFGMPNVSLTNISIGMNMPLHSTSFAVPSPSTAFGAGFSSGLTPRFSPGFGPLISPGVSGEIANVPDAAAPTASLADLFRCSEYPFTSGPISAPPPPPQSNLLSHLSSSHQQQQQQPHSNSSQQSNGQQQTFDAPTPGTNPVAPVSSSIPISATLKENKSSTPLPPTNTTTEQYSVNMFSSQPRHDHGQSEAEHIVNTRGQNSMQGQAPTSLPTSQIQASANAPSQPFIGPVAYVNGTTSVGTLSTGTGAGNGDLVSSENIQDPSVPLQNISGHRSVLGSGIQSTAVQEAQMQARKKAEVFANLRKRKRVEQPEQQRSTAVPSEDSKLTPEERKRKRYERRLALNRESAAVSRVRRREYVKLLEERLVSAEKERVRLATELDDMQQQHNKLRERLLKLEGDIDRDSA